MQHYRTFSYLAFSTVGRVKFGTLLSMQCAKTSQICLCVLVYTARDKASFIAYLYSIWPRKMHNYFLAK